MANKPLQIQKENPAHNSMDFFFLKEEGIKLVQQLAGKIWTDYNPHDPGVTILEQLCYALADLGFRTDFKIQDLLNARSRQQRKALNSTFFDASEILPSNPVCLNDYRKLIIDNISAVKNAWINPVHDNLQGIKGLYRILLQVDENSRNPKDLEKIKSEVYALFNEHRNLCEDIENIRILDIDKITIYADLDISSDIVAEEVLAEILFKLEDYLNPSIRYYTIDELIEEGYSVDEIFDGPVPVHGIIKNSDLRPMRQEVYISKLVEIISGIEGIRRINFFKVEKDGFPVEGDVIRIEEMTYPVLDMDTIDDKWKKLPYPIRFQRGNLNYELDLNTTNQLLYSLYARYKKGYQMKLLYNEKDFPSVLKNEDIPKYFSIQNSFPGTYGLSKYGLPNNIRATRERLAMIKQLRGYLLFFEQIMANYLSQLANIKSLFSLDETLDKSYFSQIPDDIPGLDEIIGTKDRESFKRNLDKVMSEFDPYLDRRNRILDHLLARFGEQFTTDFLLRVSQYVGYDMDGGDNSPEQELIDAKIEFLKNYVDISRNRSKGFNYLALFHVIHQQELAWAEVFETLIKQYQSDEERDVIRKQFLSLRTNYPIRDHQKDFFSMAILHKSAPDIALIQNKKLFEGLDLPEIIFEQLKEINLNYSLKARDVLAKEVAGLERRICLLLNIIQSGNESLLRIFEDNKDFDDVEPFDNIISIASPNLREGFLDLEEELNRLNNLNDLENQDNTEEDKENLNSDEVSEKNDNYIELQEKIDDDIDELLSNSSEETLNYQSHFVFRAEKMDDLMNDLLSNAVFSHNYIILPFRKNNDQLFAIYYRGNKSLGCVKVRETTTRLAARKEIDRIIRYLTLVNKFSEGIHMVEHILLRPQAQDRHGFRLINDQDRILLESYELGSLEDQRYLSNQLDLIATKKENYEISKDVSGSFVLFLKDYDRIIAKCPELFFTEEGANEKRNDILDYINSFKNSNIALQNNISFFLEAKREVNAGHDFYSLGMSVILPAWPSRFQNSDFRSLLCNAFVVNAPVHVDLDFYWLDISEMKDFEMVYFDWLEERNALNPLQPDLDEKATMVVEFLQKLRNQSK